MYYQQKLLEMGDFLVSIKVRSYCYFIRAYEILCSKKLLFYHLGDVI